MDTRRRVVDLICFCVGRFPNIVTTCIFSSTILFFASDYLVGPHEGDNVGVGKCGR